jgi:DNA-binding beta-propeller fold protein YncE
LVAVGDVAISPDGASLYTATRNNDAVSIFRRRASNGSLRSKGCVIDDDQASGLCPISTSALDGATAITVAPDGNSVYVVSQNDDAVVHLPRDPATGNLSPGTCIDDNDPPQGPDVCATSTNGLNSPLGVAVSPDGASTYVAGTGDSTVVAFDRDASGNLGTPRCVREVGAPESCSTDAPGLLNPQGLALSADSASLYVAAVSDDDVVAFQRELPPP